MKTSSFRQTYADVDLAAIATNTVLFKESLAKGCQLMAVVKGNGYGHGAVQVARVALANGATYLGVAILDEALELRDAGITAPILVLGYTPPEAIHIAATRDVTISVLDESYVSPLLKQADKKINETIKIHLKVDTGMGRVGLQTNDALLHTAKALSNHDDIVLEGLFTHFAEADDLNSSYTDEQFKHFMVFSNLLKEAGIHIPIRHCCNSAGTLYHHDKHLDLVRVGISLYGLRPDAALTLPLPLQQAMRLYAMIASVRTLYKGESISYGRTYFLADTRHIATLAIGYADGLSRALSNKGSSIIHGQRAPIIGRVCMDQTMIDVTGIEQVKRGDVVEFSIDEMAELTGTINYEIVCAVAPRVPRYYRGA